MSGSESGFAADAAALPDVRGLPQRRLGRVVGALPGPLLIAVAGMHGNEPAGIAGLRRVLSRLAESPRGFSGELLALLGNRAALVEGRRYIARDLNRLWAPEQVATVRARRPGEPAADADEAEQRGLDVDLRAALASAPRGRTYLLDLHTTSSVSPAFAVLDDTLRNRAFALELPVPLVLGLEEELPGTLLYHLCGEGVVTLAFEAGQHQDPASADRAEAAVWIALEACGALPRGERPEVATARQFLAAESGAAPHVVEVRYRHAIMPEDGFRMRPGFASFEPVRAGQPLADDRRGEVVAREDALLLMPLYQPLGSDGFFLVRPVASGWLRLSALLRRLRLGRALPWLPGVGRHPEIPGALWVDRRTARWLVREVFHLLGYRLEGGGGGEEDQRLLFRRRSHEG